MATFTRSLHMKSISLQFLQHFLLRVALLLDINISGGIKFDSFDWQNIKIRGFWTCFSMSMLAKLCYQRQSNRIICDIKCNDAEWIESSINVYFY